MGKQKIIEYTQVVKAKKLLSTPVSTTQKKINAIMKKTDSRDGGM